MNLSSAFPILHILKWALQAIIDLWLRSDISIYMYLCESQYSVRIACMHSQPAGHVILFNAIIKLCSLFQSCSGHVLCSILLNSVDLLRVDLQGVQVLLPHLITALEMVLPRKEMQIRWVLSSTANPFFSLINYICQGILVNLRSLKNHCKKSTSTCTPTTPLSVTWWKGNSLLA